MAEYYDRYKMFKEGNKMKIIPNIKLREKDSDKRVIYKLGSTRLDVLSQKYYNNPYHGWLILLANPEFGGMEFNIPDNVVIRVPFPFKESLEDYYNAVKNHLKLYGE